jgi:4-hydroxybenzoate polyprenyltransferase
VTAPGRRDLAELVRLPAVLSVPGDALVGSATARAPGGARLAVSAALLYLAGMALNDYADRAVDMLERPSRPIPSGRVPARTAHRLALHGTLAGVGTAGFFGGRRALRVALPLAGSIWVYDLRAKSGPAGPGVMAACRGLDVLLGASTGYLPAAVPAAAVVAAHTATLTAVSQDEVRGGDSTVARTAVTRTAGVAAAAATLTVLRALRRHASGDSADEVLLPAALSAAFLLGYARRVGSGYGAAAADPSPKRLQRAVGQAVLGSAALQAGLLAGAGALPQAVAVAAARPLATALARGRGVS